MSTTENQVAAGATPPPTKRRWPDLSAYGIYFGVTRMPNGESRMVMVDENAAWAQLARQLGFVQSRWIGVYSKSNPRLDFKGMSTQFPKGKIIELTDDEIRSRIHPLLLAHKDRRLSQLASNKKRLSWHPTKISTPAATSTPAVEEVEAKQVKINPEEALHQTIFLGQNFQGQDVFESGDGGRFIKAGETVLVSESQDHAPSPVFLRSTGPSDLVQVAAGMVREISSGKNLHSDDFIRYVDAVNGTDAFNDKELVTSFHAALDSAMQNRVSSFSGATREAFDEALKMHEGRPSFWREAGTIPTPLPIAVVMQALAAARVTSLQAEGQEVDIIDLTSNPGSHSWTLPSTSIADGDYPEHDIALAGVFSTPISERNVSGVRVSRQDSLAFLESISKRRDKGMTVFTLSTNKTGRLDPEFKRVISSVGQNYEVRGLIDLDAGLFGAGNTLGSRILVVGDKRPRPDFTFSVPTEIPVVFEYESLWNWAETVKSLDSAETLTFGDDGREENRWQAPYIPKSQISEPQAMCPRNLLGPVRKALARIVEVNGIGIDEFLCHKLGWTMSELEARLDAEQADAAAIGIQSIDDGKGFVCADMTGLGKGRVTAVMAVYAKKVGIPVMFMTEKADLFTDFYRDVADIESMHVLGKPFILNNNLIVRDSVTNKVIARSPTKEVASTFLSCGEFPADYDLVLATYSQFNREYDAVAGAYRRRAALSLREMERGTLTPFEALMDLRDVLDLPDYGDLANQAGSVLDAAYVASYETGMANAARMTSNPEKAAEHDLRATYPTLDVAGVKALLKPLLGASMTSLKHQWAHSTALDGVLLILDEAHVAAGDLSQTGVNLCNMIERAQSVCYSSATFAKDIKNFRLYSRLFPDSLRVASISETLSRGGEPMQEIASAMLAEDGRLIRREHDLSALEFRVTQETTRYDRNVEWANNFAEILAEMSELSGEVSGIAKKLNGDAKTAAESVATLAHQALVAAANLKTPVQYTRGGMPKAPKAIPKVKAIPLLGVAYTNFASKLYNLSRAFSMSLTADLAADEAIAALQAGRKPVITVESTMETAVRELIDGVNMDLANESLDEPAAESSDDEQTLQGLFDPLSGIAEEGSAVTGGLLSSNPAAGKGTTLSFGKRVSFKDILGAYIDVMFSAWEYRYAPDGTPTSRKRISLANPALEALGQAIVTRIGQMAEIPLSPIDLVEDRIREAGYSVDEISGRQYRLIENVEANHDVMKMPKRNKLALKNDFNSGQLNALVLSKSGSTGISLHASRTFSDQSQRQLIELQPAADIAQRLQFWGRVNRKGQVCNPIITMLSSGLPAENRLIAMQNNKLRKMSANTNGSADNSAINETAPDILNKIGNEVCFRWMEANAKIASIIGFEMADLDEYALRSSTKFVDMLTGRMMMFPVYLQERIYSEIVTEFNAVMEQYEMEGLNPLKSAEFDLKAVKLKSKVIQVATGTESVFDHQVVATELEYEVKMPALSSDLIEADLADGRKALIDEFGENYIEAIIADVTQIIEAEYSLLLSKRFASVQEALADETGLNAVGRAASRLKTFTERLPLLDPGSIILFSDDKDAAAAKADDDSWDADKIIVTGLKIPKTNKKSFANYKVIGWSRDKRKRVEIALSNIINRKHLNAVIQGHELNHGVTLREQAQLKKPLTAKTKASRIDDAKQYHRRFFADTSYPIEGKRTRIVLEGNLYKAAEIADSIGSGQTVTYSDAKGVWHHSVLMPSTATLKSAANLPILIVDAETMRAAARGQKARYEECEREVELENAGKKGRHLTTHWEKRTVYFSDTFKTDRNSTGLPYYNYILQMSTEGIELYITNGKAFRNIIVANKEICELLDDGKFDVTGANHASGRVSADNIDAFLEAFLKLTEDKGVKVLLEGDKREWFNAYVSSKTGLANTALEVAEQAIADTSSEELTALLAAP